MAITEGLLAEAICSATRNAASKLFQQSGESFYYFSLISTGEAQAPYISAWSWEKLAQVPEPEREFVKWSYADSPYCEFGAEFFSEVRELFAQRPDILTLEERERFIEYELRFRSMESALALLDNEGLFGKGEKRNRIVINAEVMPPDYTNTERAKRLNPAIALVDWLAEIAE